MIIKPKCILLWKNSRMMPGLEVEVSDADGEHLIAEGVAELVDTLPDPEPPAAKASIKKGH
jgi:hypothetical protein